MSEEDEDFKRIWRTKKTTIRTVSFPNEVDEYLETVKGSVSKYISNLVRADMEKRKIKEKIEEAETKIDLTGHPLSEDEIRFAADLQVEDLAEWELNHFNKTLPFKERAEKFAVVRISDWFTLLHRYEGGKELLDKIVDRVAETFPKIAEVKGRYFLFQHSRDVEKYASDHVIEELDKLLKPLFQIADIMWQKKWKAKYNKIIADDRTLENYCLAMDEVGSMKGLRQRSFSIKELAGTLGLTYQQAYKIAPLLIEEGYNIQYRAKKN